MNNIVAFILKKRLFSAVSLAAVATCFALLQGVANFHNDESQLYFMLLNGGDAEGALGYSIYINYVLGWCIAKLSVVWPSVNVLLVFLYVLAFVACCSANFYVLDAQSKADLHEGRYSKCFLLSSCLLLLAINFVCMKNMQYTHVAVWAAVCGVLMMGSAEEKGPWRARVLWGTLLLAGAYELREAALLPAFFVAAVALWRHRRHKKILCACAGGVLLIAVLFFANVWAYSTVPEWQSSRRNFLFTCVHILDSPDNSGIDKAKALEEKGIHPHAFSTFKSFIYTPSLDGENKTSEALLIHRAGRKGLFGSQFLADRGILAGSWSERIGKHHDTFFRALEPWIPLICASLLWLPGAQRRMLGAALGMWCVLLCYLGALFLFQRMVGRVMNPMLYGTAIWLLALPLKSRPLADNKIVCMASVCMALLSVLFVKRHWPELMDFASGASYCEAHPDTLYLTTTQQCGLLYPRGFCGYSYRWLSQSNVIPIADGWCFYSPAYASALRRRGFQSLEAAYFHPRTRIVVRRSNLAVLPQLEKLAEVEWGKKVELSVVDTYGGLCIVKVNQQ